ncbi:MAG UNVERIFIED_CONTAM: hypothetical protein LVR29_20545 [Microcystis novacekii LVE1205-3]
MMDLEELGKLAREAVDQFQMLSESEGAAVSDQTRIDVLDGFSAKGGRCLHQIRTRKTWQRMLRRNPMESVVLFETEGLPDARSTERVWQEENTILQEGDDCHHEDLMSRVMN